MGKKSSAWATSLRNTWLTLSPKESINKLITCNITWHIIHTLFLMSTVGQNALPSNSNTGITILLWYHLEQNGWSNTSGTDINTKIVNTHLPFFMCYYVDPQ